MWSKCAAFVAACTGTGGALALKKTAEIPDNWPSRAFGRAVRKDRSTITAQLEAARHLPSVPTPVEEDAEEVASSLDIDRCAAKFPEYASTLDRTFGTRIVYKHQLSEEPEGRTDVSGRLAFRLDALPDRNVTVTLLVVGRGEAYKREALTKALTGAVERSQHVLWDPLQELNGSATLYWRHMGADCPETRRHSDSEHKEVGLGLPLHGWSTDANHADIAMPDFTFEAYKDIHSSETNPRWNSDSWADVSARLHEVKKTRRGFIWRGMSSSTVREKFVKHVQAGPPAHLQSLFDRTAPDGFDVQLMSWETTTNNRQGFVSLYDQCQWTYTFHIPGHHYSAMVKYKLACAQTVFMIGEDTRHRQEFWYDTLMHGKNIFFIKDDLSNLWDVLEAAMTEPGKADAVAVEGQRLADTYLSQRGIDCYWAMYFTRYYFPMLKNASECDREDCSKRAIEVGEKGINMHRYDNDNADGVCGDCGC